MSTTINILNIISPQLKESLGIEDSIPEGEYREFRLLRAGVVDPSSSKKTATPQMHGYPGKAMIHDPFDKNVKDKLIMNITGYRPVSGEPGKPTVMDPQIGYVKFDSSGSIKCLPQDYNLYLFLMCDNRNRDNQYRKTNKAPLYYLVDEKKEIAGKNNSFAYKVLAGSLLTDITDEQIAEYALKVQRAYAHKYKFDFTLEAEKLLASLNAIADKDPLDIILSIKEDNTYARVVADDAIARRVIFFDDHEDVRIYKWKRTPGEKGKVNIVKAEQGAKPINTLVSFLVSKEGSEHYAELRAQYEGYYSKKSR
jgi:hypothetical protein